MLQLYLKIYMFFMGHQYLKMQLITDLSSCQLINEKFLAIIILFY